MNWTQVTGLIILCTVFGLGIYDVFVGYKTGGTATISWVIYTWTQRYPAIAFGFGFLMGHLFAQMCRGGD